MLAMFSRSGWPGVGKVKIRYYVVLKGRGYWRPTPTMRGVGFADVRCGPDGPAAWAIAEEWNRRWQAARRGEPEESTPEQTREQAEIARRYPRGSVGEAWQRYIRTEEWARRPLSTRTKEWWPAWFRIRAMWGDVDPRTIAYEMISDWRSHPVHGLEARHGIGVAHKTIKVWRAFWKIMAAMRYCERDGDPSLGIRNAAPPPRSARWSEGEVVRRVKDAWRLGYRGLAAIIAVSWDTSFSPVDARTLRAGDREVRADGTICFDLTVRGRAKTGRAAIGTLSRRSTRLIRAYWAGLGVEMTDEAYLFRNRSGQPYRDDTLADDFAAVREIASPGDKRQLRDMRRSGATEAVAGGATPLDLSAKLANSIQSANTIHRTYAPVEIAAVDGADAARRRGRTRMRAASRDKRG